MRAGASFEAAGSSGYDYVCIDMQHGLNDYDMTLAMLQATARTPTVPIVRVPWNEQGIIGVTVRIVAAHRSLP